MVQVKARAMTRSDNIACQTCFCGRSLFLVIMSGCQKSKKHLLNALEKAKELCIANTRATLVLMKSGYVSWLDL